MASRVRKERIPVRGLKHWTKVLCRLTTTVRQKRTNPREGIETDNLSAHNRSRINGQKRTNPREGIETFVYVVRVRGHVVKSEKNESP